MAGEMPEVVTRFIADTTAFVANVERAIASDEAFARSTEAADVALAAMKASLVEVTAAVGEAATAQTTLADAQKAAGDAATIDAEMQAALADAERVAAEAAMASVDASIALAKADKTAGEAAVVLGDEQVAMGTKAKAAGEASAGAAVSHNKLNKAILGVGAAVVYSTVKAASFQSEVQRLYSAAGLTGAKFDDVSKQIMGVANATGFAGTEIAQAMYHPVSAGLDLAKSINTVTESAKLARIHGANLEETTYALSSVMKAYNIQAQDVTKTSGLLNAIVGQGDMRFNDFNQSIKNWTPTGAQMGISIQSMGAALAYLTDRGNSAEVASTRLTMGLSMVTAGSKAANTYLKDLGLTSGKVSLQNQSLAATMNKAGLTTNKIAADLKKPDGIYVALQDLQGAFRKSGLSAEQADQVMAKIFGGGRSDKAMLSLMQNLDGVKTKYNDIGKAVGGYGDSWAKTQQTTTQQFHQTTAEVKNLATEFGTTLLPAVNGALSGINKAFGGLLGNKTTLSVLKAVVPAILAIVAAVKIWSAVQLVFNAIMDANPISLIIIAIGALIAMVIYAYNHFTWFRNGVNAVGRALAAAWTAVWHACEAVVRWFGNTALPWITARLKIFSDWWHQHGQEVVTVAKAAWHMVSDIVVTAWRYLWDGEIKPGLVILGAAWKLGWGLVRDTVKLIWGVIRSVVSLGIHQVLDVIGIVLDLLTGKWGKAWSDLKKLASDTLHGTIQVIQSITSGFGTLLYDAGKNLIQGLINGISSMASAAWNSMSDLVSGLKGFLPNSPAKWGPFSGKGDPYLSGAHIANAVGQGVTDNTAAPVAAMNTMATAMSAAIHKPGPPGAKAGSTAAEEKHLQSLMRGASKKEAGYDKEEAHWEALADKYASAAYKKHHKKTWHSALEHALAQADKYADLGDAQDALYKKYGGQLDRLLHPGMQPVSPLSAKLRGRAEYQAAMAAQGSLQAMRNSVYGGWFQGGPSTLGSGHGTVVQTVVNVNVGGSVRSDRDIVSMVQQGLLQGRKTTTLPKGR